MLADLQVFYSNLRGFHWNVKGHGFFVLHSKYEELYNDAAEKVDEVAERILNWVVLQRAVSVYICKLLKSKRLTLLVAAKRLSTCFSITTRH